MSAARGYGDEEVAKATAEYAPAARESARLNEVAKQAAHAAREANVAADAAFARAGELRNKMLRAIEEAHGVVEPRPMRW